MKPTRDLRVRETRRLLPPRALREELPSTEGTNRTVVEGRQAIVRILERQDPRLLVVVGPCSIHDLEGAREYARRLGVLREAVADQLFVVMRVYFEKPRTTIGWKGLINDPHLDGSYDIEAGLRAARGLLLEITAQQMPVATEFLDPIVPQYLDDLVSWAAIGARTTESQTHREMASGLSMPVGFKNGTDGGLQVAIDAMGAAKHPHSFLGIDADGVTSIIRTTGNPHGHVVLRGGRQLINYDEASIEQAEQVLSRAGLRPVVMVDCSHANSAKQPRRQEEVWFEVLRQRVAGRSSVIGLMVESYLEEGSQPIPRPGEALRFGVSITDPCINWEMTERMLQKGAEQLREMGRKPSAVLAS